MEMHLVHGHLFGGHRTSASACMLHNQAHMQSCKWGGTQAYAAQLFIAAAPAPENSFSVQGTSYSGKP